MTRYVLQANPPSVVFPATPVAVRQAFPNVSFPSGFQIEDFPPQLLQQFKLYPVIEAIPPAFAPETQRLVELTPTADANGEWTAQYSVVNLAPAEVAARAAAMAPSPDYVGFEDALLRNASFQAMINHAMATAPFACMSIPALLAQVADQHSPVPLITAMDQVVSAAHPTTAEVQQIVDTAEAYHLPPTLIDPLLRVHL